MAHAPENRVLLDNDASYYTAPQTRASRSLTVARDLTLGFVAVILPLPHRPSSS